MFKGRVPRPLPQLARERRAAFDKRHTERLNVNRADAGAIICVPHCANGINTANGGAAGHTADKERDTRRVIQQGRGVRRVIQQGRGHGGSYSRGEGHVRSYSRGEGHVRSYSRGEGHVRSYSRGEGHGAAPHAAPAACAPLPDTRPATISAVERTQIVVSVFLLGLGVR